MIRHGYFPLIPAQAEIQLGPRLRGDERSKAIWNDTCLDL